MADEALLVPEICIFVKDKTSLNYTTPRQLQHRFNEINHVNHGIIVVYDVGRIDVLKLTSKE